MYLSMHFEQQDLYKKWLCFVGPLVKENVDGGMLRWNVSETYFLLLIRLPCLIIHEEAILPPYTLHAVRCYTLYSLL